MKSPLASKTLWVNGLTILAAVLLTLSGMTDVIPANVMYFITIGLAAVNFALRFVTTQTLNVSGSKTTVGLLAAGISLGCASAIYASDPITIQLPEIFNNIGSGSIIGLLIIVGLGIANRQSLASILRSVADWMAKKEQPKEDLAATVKALQEEVQKLSTK